MNDDAYKAAERLGYARGYNAGRKRKERERSVERKFAEERAFFDRALLAALPATILSQGWEDSEGKPIISRTERTKLACNFADEALKFRRSRRP